MTLVFAIRSIEVAPDDSSDLKDWIGLEVWWPRLRLTIPSPVDITYSKGWRKLTRIWGCCEKTDTPGVLKSRENSNSFSS